VEERLPKRAPFPLREPVGADVMRPTPKGIFEKSVLIVGDLRSFLEIRFAVLKVCEVSQIRCLRGIRPKIPKAF